MSFFHKGTELFRSLNLSVESAITYSDFCTDLLFPFQNGIKFTDKALLMLHPHHEHDDWIEAESIDFYLWDNVHSIQNIKGSTTIEEYSRAGLSKWLATHPTPRIPYPFLFARPGNIAFIAQGMPKSVRSKKGKERLRQEVQILKNDFLQHFGPPDTGPVEIMIEVFSSDESTCPDVDRLSISIMDAFEGTVYVNDKQVRRLQPRIFSSRAAYKILESTTEPMDHFQLTNIPAGSLYPLATGIIDYYVVRILTYWS